MLSRQPVSGAAIQSGSLSATTNGDGRFTVTQASAPTSALRTSVSADGYMTHETTVAFPRASGDVQLDLISLAPPFLPTLYRQLVRNGLESSELYPIYRWSAAPRIALSPFDDAGRPLPPEVMATIRATVPRAVAAWSGGVFEGVTLEETTVPDWQDGWIVMHALRNESSDVCGRESFKYRGAGQIVMARIELTLDACACGSRKISPNTVAHELAHALGFWHAEGPYLLTTNTGPGCSSFENEVITTAEATHARIAYARPPGNSDPDRDPDSFSALSSGRVRESPTLLCR